MKYFLLAFLLLSASTLSAQTTYYVATPERGGNDANSGTSVNAPFATIVKAISKVTVPGDTIYVRSGTYIVNSTVDIKKAGTAAKHYVLAVYKPDMINANSRPVFDFSSMALASANRGFSLSGANYWDIYGIVIYGAGDNGMILSNSSYTTLTFCSFTRSRDSGLQIGNLSHNVTVVNCDSYENADIGQQSSSNGGNADGFAPKLDVGDTIIFRGCRAWLNSDDGWDGYSRPANNVTAILEDCWAFNNGYYWLDGSTNSGQNGNGFKLGGSDTKDLAHHFYVVKCLSFYNKAKGFDQNSNAGSIFLYSCTGFRNGGNDFFMTSSPVTYVPGAQLIMKNNISLGARGVSLPSGSTSARSFLASNNSFSTNLTNPEILSYDTTGVTGMRGVDGSLPVLNFMRLNPAASQPYTYIDQGAALTEVVYRGQQGVPYSGLAPDLGFSESDLSVLPVKLSAFNAMLQANDLTLSWKISNDALNVGWNVERSTISGGSVWTTLGYVKKNTAGNYSFPDKNLSPGDYYYRLKQLDQDGRTTYSNQLAVKVALAGQTSPLEIYPNPAGASTVIKYTVAHESNISIKLYDNIGRMVSMIEDEKLQKGIYQKQIDTKTLAPGIYRVKLIIDGSVITKNLIRN